MLNKVKCRHAVKKLITILVIFTAAIGCSKKVTNNKSVEKPSTEIAPVPPATPVVQEKKVEEVKTIVNANPTAEPLAPAKRPTIEKTDAAEDKKKMLLMAAGKEAFSVKCSKCHELYEPSKFSAVKWEKVIDWMGPRAKLEATDKEAILAYVKNNAKK
jgi:hypothetical protein